MQDLSLATFKDKNVRNVLVHVWFFVRFLVEN